MNINKKFNEWISLTFKGLSAHTLIQFIKMNVDNIYMYWFHYDEEIDNFVYVNLFHVFIKTASENELKEFECLIDAVNNCAWL